LNAKESSRGPRPKGAKYGTPAAAKQIARYNVELQVKTTYVVSLRDSVAAFVCLQVEFCHSSTLTPFLNTHTLLSLITNLFSINQSSSLSNNNKINI
jgi:hypothetical protein